VQRTVSTLTFWVPAASRYSGKLRFSRPSRSKTQVAPPLLSPVGSARMRIFNAGGGGVITRTDGPRSRHALLSAQRSTESHRVQSFLQSGLRSRRAGVRSGFAEASRRPLCCEPSADCGSFSRALLHVGVEYRRVRQGQLYSGAASHGGSESAAADQTACRSRAEAGRKAAQRKFEKHRRALCPGSNARTIRNLYGAD